MCLQSTIESLRSTISRLESDNHTAVVSTESAAEQERRLKHKALKLLSVCRKQEKALAATVILYHHCFSDAIFTSRACMPRTPCPPRTCPTTS